MDFRSNLSTEQRLSLLEEENHSLKNRMMKAENDVSTAVALGLTSVISLAFISIIIISLAAQNGVLETDFWMNGLHLLGIAIMGIALPSLVYKIALYKLRN